MNNARALLDFIAAAPTPYHAVSTTAGILRDAGFAQLDEREPWRLEPGTRAYLTRGDASIVGFVVGQQSPADAGFLIAGAHTDSPNLRIKPNADIAGSGCRSLGVEVYGGVLLSTWTDRDLGIAGRLLVAGNGGVKTRFVRIDRPVARVPQLAIHLDREVNDRGLVLNKETHMRPIIGLEDGPAFMEWLASEVAEAPANIRGFDLMLYDLQPPVISGISNEFIHAARLDNLASCHAALTGLTSASGTASAATRVIAFYDHEEVGSGSAQGASGSFLGDVLERIAASDAAGEGAYFRAKARSFMVSADMAHAVHPNYAEKHDARHGPRMNEGPVIKINANARYATDGESAARFANICREADVPCQTFVMRADMACGSTIGPLVSTRLGVRTVDVGNPMLSMHSCREMAGARDHSLMIRALERFFAG